ncbi:virulence RhuM family protein [Dyadobacter chenhuakuii]|uniref:Virulence RhuM family protein n=1 Tax=Dyadobacter chenhuakuii TaxID=2909339 RepID=A0A9X1TW36_9BACT|nr:virulence RhuM family protein [Dyadobacter chenhuakuii]MCF2501038.1 virulence RhuM family protein [Dyadobacter chenhuakuii]
MENKGQLLIYRTPNGSTEIEVALENETVWLTQKQMAELFQKDPNTIGVHISNIYKEGELEEVGTTSKSEVVQKEGNRYVKREVNIYNLDVIISVGYRVNSLQGTHFRVWATKQLREYMVKGFILDDARLKGEPVNYFEELQERVRSIRTSEKNFWQKIKDIFAFGSMDYDKDSEIARTFFASVQNMFHYAIHGHTASELIKERADAYKDHMGLFSWSGQEITKKDVLVAKNYLSELELKRLNLLADQFLSFAELQSIEKRPMYMATWVSKLIQFLNLNDKPILRNSGKVSAEVGKQIALKEFERFEKSIQEEASKLSKYLKKNSHDVAFEDVVKVEVKESNFNRQLKGLMAVPPPKKEPKK